MLLALAASASAGPVGDRIYPAPQAPLTLDGTPSGTRFVDVTTADGLSLRGLHVPPSRADRPLLLVFHGNASSAGTVMRWLDPVVGAGYGILAAEYRGYNGGPGKPSGSRLAMDAKAFLAEARRLAAGRPVWVVGHSLGGGVALDLSRSEKLDRLVTIGAFTALKEMTSGIARSLVPDDYRNIDSVRSLDEPYALVHGLRDQVVPWQMGQELHKAASLADRRGQSYILKEEGHQPEARTLLTILDDLHAAKPARDSDLAGIKIVTFGR